MKRNLLSLLALVVAMLASAAPAKSVDIIDPPYWWAGMHDTELQIMLHGDGIGSMRPSVAGDDVRMISYTGVESPNYLILYLDLKDAKPGTFDITLTEGKKQIKVPYELRARRESTADIGGFGSEDVLYLIMPDRFVNGDPTNDEVPMENEYKVDRSRPMGRHGGDLEGIRQHLDYFNDLGVTAIWLNPVLINDARGGSYHGYFSSDLYRVDPRLGTNDEYVTLIDEAHKRGIKVVMDMIFNHIGPNHIWVKDRPAADWVGPTHDRSGNHAIQIYFDPYASDSDSRSMKNAGFSVDVNQRNPHVEKYLIQNSIWWIENARVDGIRQDTYCYADYDMMRRWNEAVYAEYPQYNIVGEVWIENPAGTAWWQRNSRLSDTNSGLKSVMDFKLMSIAAETFLDTERPEGRLGDVYAHMAYDYLYPDIDNVLRFLDNHDTSRFVRDSIADLGGWKQGATFLLTIPGIPQIYYGHELLMNGDKNLPGGDGNVRKDFPGGWDGDEINWFDPSQRTAQQQEAYEFISKLLHWRQGKKVISEGSMKHYKPERGVYVYERTLGDETVLVVLNGAKHESEIDMNRFAESLRGRHGGRDVVSGEHVDLSGKLTLPPKSTMIIELDK